MERNKREKRKNEEKKEIEENIQKLSFPNIKTPLKNDGKKTNQIK
jgi:hypothetical protein